MIEPDHTDYPGRLALNIKNGTVIIGSDGHYWPGPATTAHRALVKFIKDLQPQAVIFNGDALDASTISRHPPIGWEKRPSLAEELEACKERMNEIILASPQRARKVWTLGNHDSSFETKLATVAPEFSGVPGIHLKDHFPDWMPSW